MDGLGEYVVDATQQLKVVVSISARPLPNQEPGVYFTHRLESVEQPTFVATQYRNFATCAVGSERWNSIVAAFWSDNNGWRQFDYSSRQSIWHQRATVSNLHEKKMADPITRHRYILFNISVASIVYRDPSLVSFLNSTCHAFPRLPIKWAEVAFMCNDCDPYNGRCVARVVIVLCMFAGRTGGGGIYAYRRRDYYDSWRVLHIVLRIVAALATVVNAPA